MKQRINIHKKLTIVKDKTNPSFILATTYKVFTSKVKPEATEISG